MISPSNLIKLPRPLHFPSQLRIHSEQINLKTYSLQLAPVTPLVPPVCTSFHTLNLQKQHSLINQSFSPLASGGPSLFGNPTSTPTKPLFGASTTAPSLFGAPAPSGPSQIHALLFNSIIPNTHIETNKQTNRLMILLHPS